MLGSLRVFRCFDAGVYDSLSRSEAIHATTWVFIAAAAMGGFTSTRGYCSMGGHRWLRQLTLLCCVLAAPFAVLRCVLNPVAVSYECAPMHACDPYKRLWLT